MNALSLVGNPAQGKNLAPSSYGEGLPDFVLERHGLDKV